VFGIRTGIDLHTDPAPTFQVNTDPDPAPDLDSDPSFFMTKIKKKNFNKKNLFSVTNCYTDID